MPGTLKQASFIAGELAPSLHARTDLARWAHGLRRCENFIVQRHGGATNRPGTRYVGSVKDSSKTVRLVPFIWSNDQAYVLEFGNLYVRFYYAGGRVLNPTTEAIVEVTTPYVEADLPHLQCAQRADTMFIVHRSYDPRKLVRSDHHLWALSTISYSPSIGPPTTGWSWKRAGKTDDDSHPAKEWEWVVTTVNADGEESGPSAVIYPPEVEPGSGFPPTSPQPPGSSGEEIVLYPDRPAWFIWTAVSGADYYNVYRGRNGVFGWVGSTETASFHDDGQAPVYTDTPPNWTSPWSGVGYPAAIAFHDQRLVVGGTTTMPQTIWGSRVGFYNRLDHSIPSKDDDAFEVTLAANRMDEIRAITSLRALLILTASGEYRATGMDDGVITPNSMDVRRQSGHGAARIQPVEIGNVALFVGARGTTIRQLAYDLQSDGYSAPDLTVLASHLFEGYSITDWTWASCPFNVLWVVRSDGTLLGLTFLRDQEVAAWHRHVTDGAFESVCSIPEGSEDALYAVVRRTINGSTVRYVERFATRLLDDIRDAIFLDSSLGWSGYATDGSTVEIVGGSVAASTRPVSHVDSAENPFTNPTLAYDADGTSTGAVSTPNVSPYISSLAVMFEGTTPIVRARGRMYIRISMVGYPGATFSLEYTVDGGSIWTPFATPAPGDTGWFETPYLDGVVPEDFGLRMSIDLYAWDGFHHYFYDALLDDCTGDLAAGEMVTVQSSVAKFAATDVGDHLWVESGGTRVRMRIRSYVSTTEIECELLTPAPAATLNAEISDWAFARTVFSGLDHLEGATVSALADGSVISDLVVASGEVALAQPTAIVQIGLPYVAEIETLPLAVPDGEIRMRRKSIHRVSIEYEDSRGLWIGTDPDNLSEIKRDDPEEYDEPPALQSGCYDVRPASTFGEDEHVYIRQPNPLPATILSLFPEINVGG